MNQIPQSNFSHLSVKDLLEARDLFHAHLISKQNVVATAIGRYVHSKGRFMRLRSDGKYGSTIGSEGDSKRNAYYPE